ncbi:hypothetical protein F5890DRAFT_1478499 [Lentinula detonsa]|uniref:Uncharacterized protein n=1 Tax=Lentinula detonsa TaxID=2804962 RepID=A0AA38UNB1_9AGAR|nr:hypothetical protein F5890DRAFT_1478499 [Lentinula detonsa]
MNFNSGIIIGVEHRLFDYDWETFVNFTLINWDGYVLKVFRNAVKLVNTTALIDGHAQGEKLVPKKHAVEVVQYWDWISKEFLPAYTLHNNYNFNSLSDMEVLLGKGIFYNLALLKEHNNPSFNPNNNYFEASLEELISSVEIKQANINCLDIPIPSTKVPGCQGLATQAETEGYIRQRVDQEGMYWAIAGQKAAYSLLHMDANGLCTVVEPKNGQKYWVIARLKNDVIMSSIGLLDLLDVELENIIILQPGDILAQSIHLPTNIQATLSHCMSLRGRTGLRRDREIISELNQVIQRY